MATLTTAQIQQAYVTFFSRPADPVGLAYWQSYTGSIADLYATFAQQTEYSAAFSGLTSAQKVNVVYQNLFGRDAEQSGLLYWAARVESGAISVANLALAVSAGSQGTDSVVVSSRVTAATAFTAALDTSAEILGYSGASANAVAKTWLSAVKTDADLATAVAAVDAAVTSVSGAGGAAGVPGSTFTLTTNVDGVSGTANDDTINGTLGTSGTYAGGDNIIGGAGTDTLSLVVSSGSAAGGAGGLVGLASIEHVNVRLLNTAGTDVSMNAADWSGVEVISNASSLAGTTLTVSGLAITTDVGVYGNTDVSVAFANSTTATDAVSVALVSVGNDTTATTLASASAAATANVSLDMASADLLTAVNIDVSGTKNIARLDAGSNVTSYTVTGTGNAILVTDDTITSFNATAAAGNLDVSFSGASTLAVVGGAGNDTFRFGGTYNNGDTVDGGAGTNAVALTLAGFNRDLSTTNVQTATVTFSDAAGGTLNASASTVATFALAAGTAGNAASVSQMANATTVTLNDDDLGNVTLDYVSGASTTTLNLGSASGTVTLGTLAITDVANVTINSVGVSGAVGGTITTASFDSDLKSLAITTSGGEADLTIGDTNIDMALGGATSLTVTSNGSAGITFNAVDLAGTALANVIVSANGSDAADVTLGDVSGSAITLVSLTANSGADITVGTLDLGDSASAATRDEALTIVQGTNSDVTVGAITVSGQGTLTVNLTQNGTTAAADIAQLTLVKTGTADAVAQNLTFAAVAVAADSTVSINGIDLAAAGTGAQLTFGTITVGQDGGYSAGIVSGTGTNIDISDINVTVGASATATFNNFIGFSGGAIGSTTVTLGSDATATFGTVTASAVGTHTIIAATGASANFGNITAEQTIGAIEISGVDGADVQFGTLGASAVGAIAVSGALDVTIGAITSTTVGTVDATNLGKSGAFTINLSGVTNAVEVNLGAGTNTIISGAGNDVITLTAGTTGNDNIQYSTATQGTDNIIRFFAGTTGADQIEFATGFAGASGGIIMGSAIATDATTVGLTVASTASGAITIADNVSVVVINATAFASTAAFVSAIGTGGSLEINAGTAATAGSLVVAWTDGTDTYVSVVGVVAASGANAIVDGASAMATLAVLQGVTPGALVAANFDFV